MVLTRLPLTMTGRVRSGGGVLERGCARAASSRPQLQKTVPAAPACLINPRRVVIAAPSPEPWRVSLSANRWPLCRDTRCPDIKVTSRRSAQIGPAVDVDGLARDVPCQRTAQEADRGRDLGRRNAVAGEGVVGRMMLWLGAGAMRADETRHHQVHRDLVIGEVLGETPRKADEAGFRRDHVQAVACAAVAAQAADIDDDAGAAALEV